MAFHVLVYSTAVCLVTADACSLVVNANCAGLTYVCIIIIIIIIITVTKCHLYFLMLFVY